MANPFWDICLIVRQIPYNNLGKIVKYSQFDFLGYGITTN